MSRSGDMAILDVLEGIIASKVYHFDEGPVRDYSEQNRCECGKMEIDWHRKVPRCRILSGAMLTKYVDLSEENPEAHLKHVFIDDVDSDSLLIKSDGFITKCYADRTYDKRCDYMFFTRFNGKRYVLFIELKTYVLGEQNNASLFTFTTDFDKGVVWQMLGADALLDYFVDIVHKNGNQSCNTVLINKRGAGRSALAQFNRRYLVLYKSVDKTGSLQALQQYAEPNPYILQKPIHVLQVRNMERIKIGELFARSGLEL